MSVNAKYFLCQVCDFYLMLLDDALTLGWMREGHLVCTDSALVIHMDTFG